MGKRFYSKVLAGLVIAVVAVPIFAQGTKPKPVVAVFALEGAIPERPSGEGTLFGNAKGDSLKDLIERMHKARDDEAVKAVVLLSESSAFGVAQLEEIRHAMDTIKAAGKTIYAHTEQLTMGSYALLSGASRLSIVPTGDIFIQGLYAEQPYLRGMLDKIGVQPDFLTCGEYKSAGEMFMLTGPSDAAEENREWLIDGIYESYLQLIATGRGVAVEQARRWIDEGLYNPAGAQRAGLIDASEYRQDFLALLRREYGEDVKLDRNYGKKKGADIDLSSPFGLLKFYAELLAGPKKQASDRDVIAIVYVEGPIVPGKPDSSPFALSNDAVAYSDPIRAALDQVAENERVKAVVLRVNSPGGSVVASEVILNATKRVIAKKPLVVSMGNVAGSGGYYVACGTDTIFADPSTITGSIGVVAGKLATQGMWDMVGVQWDSTQRGANAGMLTSGDIFTDTQRESLQSWMNEVYEVFKGHVVAIRGDRLKGDIEALAGGRVYTGRQAHELGLVDRLGGLDDAISFAAARAHIQDYEIQTVPRAKTFVELLINDLQGGDDEILSLALSQQSRFGAMFATLLPQIQRLDPLRVQALLTAIVHLELLQREGVLLSMPMISIRHD